MPETEFSTLAERISADQETRFAISLDRLAYAKDNHRLGSDLVRTFVRNADRTTLTGQLADDVRTFRRGLQALTGRREVLGRRYGDLAVSIRDAGGSLFDLETDEVARQITKRIAGADAVLSLRVAERAV